MAENRKRCKFMCHNLFFIFAIPCIVILGWRNPTRCNSMQIFIYC